VTGPFASVSVCQRMKSDLELRGGPGFVLLALPAFLPSVISSSYTQNKGGGAGGWGLGLSPRCVTANIRCNPKVSSPMLLCSF